MKIFSLIVSLVTVLITLSRTPVYAAPVCQHNEEIRRGVCVRIKSAPDPKTLYDQQKKILKKVKSELSRSETGFVKFNNNYKLLFEHSRRLIAKLLEEKYRLEVEASYYTKGQRDQSLYDSIFREYQDSVKAVFDTVMATILEKTPSPNAISIHVKGGCAQRGCWVKHSDHAEIPDFIELSDLKEYLNISTGTSCPGTYKRETLVNGKQSGLYKCYIPNQDIYGLYRFSDHISGINKITFDEPDPTLARIRMGYAKLQINQIDQALSYLTHKKSLLNAGNRKIQTAKIKHPNIDYLSRPELVNYLEIYRLDDKYPPQRLTDFQNPDNKEFNDAPAGFYHQYSLGSLNRLALDACMEVHYRNEELAGYCRFIQPAYDHYIMSSEIQKLFDIAIAGSIPVFQNILIVDDLIHEGSRNHQFMVWLSRVWNKSINCRLNRKCSPEKLHRYIATKYEYEEKSASYPEVMSVLVDHRLEKMAENLYVRFSRELHELASNPQGRPNLVALDQFLGLLKTAVILGRLGYYSAADLDQFIVSINEVNPRLADAGLGLNARGHDSLENFLTDFTVSIVRNNYFDNVEFARVDMQNLNDDINAIRNVAGIESGEKPRISTSQARSFLENMKLKTAYFINLLAGIVDDVPLLVNEIRILRFFWGDHYQLFAPSNAEELAETQAHWFSWEERVDQMPVYRRLYTKFKSWVNEQKSIESDEPLTDAPLENTDLEPEIYDDFINDVGIDEDFLNFPKIQVQLRENLRLFNRYFSDIPENQPSAQLQPQIVEDLQDIEEAFPEAGEGSAMIASIAEQAEVISDSIVEIASTLEEFSSSYSAIISSLGTVTTTASILGSILSSIIPIP